MHQAKQTKLLLLLAFTVAGALAPAAAKASQACPGLLNHTFSKLQDASPLPLCQFSGKLVLAVNTASYCGFTKQYQGLEALYAKYKSKGLVVVGFPSNDFGKQEPGTDKEIADFCFNTYGVKFPMASKTEVASNNKHAFYHALAQKTGQTPQWNFHKYLIAPNGSDVLSFASSITPDNATLVAQIERLLKQVKN